MVIKIMTNDYDYDDDYYDDHHWLMMISILTKVTQIFNLLRVPDGLFRK